MVVFASLMRKTFTNFYAHNAFSKGLACFVGTSKYVKYILTNSFALLPEFKKKKKKKKIITYFLNSFHSQIISVGLTH